ncbi:hypothetical protein BGW36DRAFT_428487 [Talaromyces proteolyticus]|uniref:Uncharacterized protein n=1 Tax=Talaromyces proteolyticus TaxID=1131652 RepID=A0AAD4KR99_9EURO|nr:uncharacterized protein BGW36DRAFT_428487 [Talaromyces proteolyticus]KAH8696482.1 hypothetical protein BGW36DRAFT_428487 [Talaromyces proteolyticus]
MFAYRLNPRRQWRSPLLTSFVIIYLLLFYFISFGIVSGELVNSQEHHLRKRTEPLTWAQAIQKGNALYCSMSNTVEGAQQYINTFKPGTPMSSTWTDFASFNTWGWLLTKRYTEPTYGETLNGFISNDLSLNSANGVPIEHVQSAEVVANGVKYKHSDGMYANVYYHTEGLVIVDENYGPGWSCPPGSRGGSPYVLLSQWSDIV